MRWLIMIDLIRLARQHCLIITCYGQQARRAFATSSYISSTCALVCIPKGASAALLYYNVKLKDIGQL